MTMIVNVWMVIDPKYDRPFVMTHPPADTMQRTEQTQVLRFECHVPEPTPVDEVISVSPSE